ncbi:MAG: DUF2933 domain-containing protein [Rhodospirillaceae bacterium]|nr:DUF2933 domain-containing protein [Rhodospirillaceae bacterium]
MDWLAANWVWVLIALAFVALHMFGHGGHGGHGGNNDRSNRESSERPEGDRQKGHHHHS